MNLSIERILPASEASDIIARASNGKINAYYRKFFAQPEANEGSPYREDDHVGQIGWGQ